jgi:hypothetical protein
MKRLLIASLVLSPLATFAGLYDQPYSIIQTDPSRSSDHLIRPVIVNRVDDVNAQYDNRAVVAPGKHAVTVDLHARQGFHLPTQVTFDLETKPCTRYYIVGRLETTTGQKWAPVVRSEERIGECEAKFKVAGNK